MQGGHTVTPQDQTATGWQQNPTQQLRQNILGRAAGRGDGNGLRRLDGKAGIVDNPHAVFIGPGHAGRLNRAHQLRQILGRVGDQRLVQHTVWFKLTDQLFIFDVGIRKPLIPIQQFFPGGGQFFIGRQCRDQRA